MQISSITQKGLLIQLKVFWKPLHRIKKKNNWSILQNERFQEKRSDTD